jgi:hypothetical protein
MASFAFVNKLALIELIKFLRGFDQPRPAYFGKALLSIPCAPPQRKINTLHGCFLSARMVRCSINYPRALISLCISLSTVRFRKISLCWNFFFPRATPNSSLMRPFLVYTRRGIKVKPFCCDFPKR